MFLLFLFPLKILLLCLQLIYVMNILVRILISSYPIKSSCVFCFIFFLPFVMKSRKRRWNKFHDLFFLYVSRNSWMNFFLSKQSRDGEHKQKKRKKRENIIKFYGKRKRYGTRGFVTFPSHTLFTCTPTTL